METRQCDILIVGGGPAGLSVASSLPDDVATIIVHQDREIGLPVRTSGGAWRDELERLGIPEDMYVPIAQTDAFSDDVAVRINMGPHVPAVLDITKLYKWLASQSDHKARQLWLGCKFTDCKQEADGRYLSRIRDRDGQERLVRSRFIVDASGWHSAVLVALGLRDKPERLGIGIEYEYPLGKNRPDRAILFVGDQVPSGYGWGFPTPEGTFRFGVGIISPDTDQSPRVLIDQLIANGAEQRFGIDLSGEHSTNGGILPSVAYEPKLVFGNVIRVGDSANFATPTIGEGIRTCIEFGRDLGESLGRSAKSGWRWPLWRYQWRCNRRLRLNYALGFVINQRIASFTPEQWNASIARIGRIDPNAVRAILCSQFSLRKTIRMALPIIRNRARSRLRRLGARAGLRRQG